MNMAEIAGNPDNLPSLSAVVIGRNEGTRLVRCLESLRAADYPSDRLQIIYVDTASTDNSVNAAERLGATVIKITPERPSAALARNAGLQAARGDLVHFFDGDTVVDRNWLRLGAQSLADPHILGVSGQRRELAPHATVYNFWTDQDWIGEPGECDVVGGDALFRRSDLERVGGYDPALIAGEERDLSHRLLRTTGGKMLFRAELMTQHDIDMTRFGQYWKRAVRSGWAYAEVGSRYPDLTAWRRVVRKNMLHLVFFSAVLAAGVALRSPWPIAAWLGLVVAAWLRQAWRHRAQTGSPRGALLYAAHLILAKIPVCVGHLQYFWNRLRRAAPRQLIEYRGDTASRPTTTGPVCSD
jgi:glycosyltransferase involved in cell wall biosynthesis